MDVDRRTRWWRGGGGRRADRGTVRAALPPALAALALLAVSCTEELPAPEPVIRPVRSEVVMLSGGVRERSFSGVAEATTMWNGSFKVPGTVELLQVVVGDAVGSGDVIARLDAYDYELEVQQAEAGLRQAEASARNAAANFDRIKLLYEDENATRADFDAALAADRSAREAVVSAQKSVEMATRRRDYTTLTAPFPGAVAEVPIDENENVNAGQIVVRMTIGERRQVSVAIPEAYILDIRRGDRVTVSFDALPGRDYVAAVDEVGVSSIGMATTFPVTVVLEDQTPEVRSGMSADVNFRFTAGESSDQVAVPLAAVLEDGEGHYVYTVMDAGAGLHTARRTAVVVGGVSTTLGDSRARIEIISGLQAGDRVVTAGAKRIIDGQQVRLETEPAAR